MYKNDTGNYPDKNENLFSKIKDSDYIEYIENKYIELFNKI